MLLTKATLPLSNFIDLNRYFTVSLPADEYNMPMGSQFKLAKYIFGNKTTEVLKSFKATEEIDSLASKKHFLRLINSDSEAVIYLSMLGLKEAILEADGYNQTVASSEQEMAFNYLYENDVRSFALVVEQGFTVKHLNWTILRNQAGSELDNALNYWLFSNALQAILANLTLQN